MPRPSRSPSPSLAPSLSRTGLVSAARAVARAGRRGDTILAHINPAEARLLDRVTDGGSVNPRTGLLEFWDSDGPSASGSGGENAAHGETQGDTAGRDAAYGGGWGGDGGGSGSPDDPIAVGPAPFAPATIDFSPYAGGLLSIGGLALGDALNTQTGERETTLGHSMAGTLSSLASAAAGPLAGLAVQGIAAMAGLDGWSTMDQLGGTRAPDPTGTEGGSGGGTPAAPTPPKPPPPGPGAVVSGTIPWPAFQPLTPQAAFQPLTPQAAFQPLTPQELARYGQGAEHGFWGGPYGLLGTGINRG